MERLLNMWMLFNFQSDDRYIPETAPLVIEAMLEVDDPEIFVTAFNVTCDMAYLLVHEN